MKAVAEKYIIRTVSRALELLEQFQEGDAELGLADLGNRMNLQKNNIFRLVATLKAKNYIEINNSTGKYRLGLKTRALGQVASRQIDFVSQAHPCLVELKKQCLETCYFSAVSNGYSRYLDGVESDLPVRVAHLVGSSRPLYCTAAGRILLAFMDRQKQIDLLSESEMKGFTERTITDPAKLYVELAKAAQQGFAIDDQEHDIGVVEIAAPVFDSSGVVIGALSIAGPEMRFFRARLEKELIPLLCLSAFRLSASLGYTRVTKERNEIALQPPKPVRKRRVIKPRTYLLGELKKCC